MSLTVGEAYVQATLHPFRGKIYYDTGELQYKGYCVKHKDSGLSPCGAGVKYYKSGIIKEQGIFQRRGLVCGRMYYPSGSIRFEGYCAEPRGYGPAYPVCGKFWSEDGTLLYSGGFRCTFSGLGYPTVLIPEDFGSLK